MNIGDIIKKRRAELDLTLEQIGDAVGVTKSTVRKWESGNIENMKRDKISLLAKVLKLNPVTFITGEYTELTNVTPIDQSYVFNIPVYNSVSAGFGATAVDYVIGYMPVYFENPSVAADCICINVEGDSMYPKIEDGDTIVVRKQNCVDSGTIAVVLIDGEEGLVKKIVYDESSIELHSINPMYPTVRFEGKDMNRVQVVGAVKKIIKNL